MTADWSAILPNAIDEKFVARRARGVHTVEVDGEAVLLNDAPRVDGTGASRQTTSRSARASTPRLTSFGSRTPTRGKSSTRCAL
jgi:hypothetical protein